MDFLRGGQMAIPTLCRTPPTIRTVDPIATQRPEDLYESMAT